jgi:hypothetical protein
LLALQKLKQDKEAAARSLQMGMQVPQGTIKDQLQGQVMDMTKREVVQAVAPGLQQQGQRMQAEQVQNMMGAGLPTQPAPALQGMAQGGIVGYAPGGEIVGYDGAGNPITQEQFDAMLQRETEADRAKNRRALLEFEAAIGGNLLPKGTVPPVERYPAELSREGTTFDRGRVARDANAAAERYRLMRETQNRPRPAEEAGVSSLLGSMADNYRNAMRISGEGNRAVLASSVPERSGSSSGFLSRIGEGLGNFLRRVGEGEMNRADAERSAGLYNPDAENYVRLMENPELAEAGMTDLERAKAMGLIPDERAPRPAATQPTTATAPTAPAAPTARPTITPPTEEDIAALFNDMATRTQQPAQQPAEQPKYRSRYEDRLAEIEAEKQDRMGALIDFLQAAGASGGTNLGATLMGGGSGLRAREERLRQQEADTLKSIIEDENTQAQREFNERQLAQQAEQNRLTREMQERVAAADRASQEGRTADELANRKEIARMQVDEAINRAEVAAGATVTQAQIDALKDARDALVNDPAYNSEIMNAQKQYKNDPTRLATALQSITDQYLDEYLAPIGLPTSTFEMTRPAPTE